MNALPEKSREKASGKDQVSVYSVDFTPLIKNTDESGRVVTLSETGDLKKTAKPTLGFGTKLKPRPVWVVAAILLISIFHFSFQMIFIVSEKFAGSEPVEAMVKSELIDQSSNENKPPEFEIKTINSPLPPKPAETEKKPAAEISPKPSFKKKTPVETRAERLRRTEKFLTGF